LSVFDVDSNDNDVDTGINDVDSNGIGEDMNVFPNLQGFGSAVADEGFGISWIMQSCWG
jgi:hypothetical protein